MTLFRYTLLLLAALLIAVPAHAVVITVNTLDDEYNTDGDCSLREAVFAANTDSPADACPAGSGPDEITFSVSGTLPMSALPNLVLSTDLTITGPGTGLLALDAGGTASVHSRHFQVNGGATVTISGLSLFGGYIDGVGNDNGGSIQVFGGSTLTLSGVFVINNFAGSQGGGVHASSSTLIVEDSQFISNSTDGQGGAIYSTGGAVTITRSVLQSNTAPSGGGLYSSNTGNTLTLTESTVVSNLASSGGGLYLSATSGTIERSTIVSNRANNDGGGLLAINAVSLTVTSTAIIGNTADADGNGSGDGGGVRRPAASGASFTLANTVVALNEDDTPSGSGDDFPDFEGSYTSAGFNFIGISDGSTASGAGTSVDYVGTSAAPLDPEIGSYGDHGGPTPTVSLDPTSPLIDTGSCPGEVTDQRGYVRPADGNGDSAAVCDIGPFEFNSVPLPVELVAFTATLDGSDALLAWETASETNNAGFAIEHRVPEGDAFIEAGFVPGAGTTGAPRAYAYRLSGLAPGTHALRLRQVDFDGTTAYSPEVEVSVGLAEAALTAPYPNPASGTARMALFVPAAQHVTVAVYDALGRRVAVLFEGHAEAQSARAIELDTAGLAPGAYLVRAVGTTFDAVQRLTVVR